jgi:hypothetical protein
LLSYYSRWIHNFSDKIKPLIKPTFPLDSVAAEAFENLKTDIIGAALQAVERDTPFVVETDASEGAVAAT